MYLSSWLSFPPHGGVDPTLAPTSRMPAATYYLPVQDAISDREHLLVEPGGRHEPAHLVQMMAELRAGLAGVIGLPRRANALEAAPMAAYPAEPDPARNDPTVMILRYISESP